MNTVLCLEDYFRNWFDSILLAVRNFFFSRLSNFDSMMAHIIDSGPEQLSPAPLEYILLFNHTFNLLVTGRCGPGQTKLQTFLE